MNRVLIVDDESDIRMLIRRYLEMEHYEVAEAADGLEAVTLCEQQDYDLVIMDVMMPDMDGYTACKKIRAQKDIPMLMLSARGTEYDKLFGFEVGVDDYVVKPFSPKELLARVRVIIGRHQRSAVRMEEASAVRQYGMLEINEAGHEIFVSGNKKNLTAKEYDLLLYMVKNRGIVLTRNQILDAVWSYECEENDRTVDWQIKLLRNKLEECRGYIVTMRGVGYKFEVEQ